MQRGPLNFCKLKKKSSFRDQFLLEHIKVEKQLKAFLPSEGFFKAAGDPAESQSAGGKQEARGRTSACDGCWFTQKGAGGRDSRSPPAARENNLS